MDLNQLSAFLRETQAETAEVLDLDQDGRMDLIVAELGSPVPTDDRVGGVVWLKRTGNRHFEVVRLLSHVGRVADVQAPDFDADGDIDLVVAVFGWIVEGSVLYLENTSNGGAVTAESFQPHVLDKRHGAIHVPVVDLNRDGRPDIVALLAQEHETVVAYLNQGAGRFEQQDLFTARHPHWGFSGIEPIDLDQDGDLDFLLTNGDTLDDQVQFKPYQGVAWIENNGELPYELHWIDTYYGAHRAEAADMDGDGDLDIVVSSFLPGLDESRRKGMRLPGICWYEQKPGRKFVPHVLADLPCDQATLVIGDVDGDGRPDVITGVLQIRASKRKRPPVDVWLNRPRSER